MPAGRPTKYTPELLEKAWEYVNGEWRNHEIVPEMKSVIPSHEGLAIYLEISRTCMYDWAQEEGKEEFSYILEDCNVKQKAVLLLKGLNGEFNSNIAKLALGSQGMSEKQETKHSGAVGVVDLSNKTDEELQAIIDGSG